MSPKKNYGYHVWEIDRIQMFMFGKPSRETKPETTTEDTSFNQFSTNLAIDKDRSSQLSVTEPEIEITESENSELVNTVEKISLIVSPYFIVIVGLSLYEKNFLIGTILIVVGILSLLKVSSRDIAAFLEWFKNFLGLEDNQN